MNMPMRIFWLIFLMIFTAGCSGYRMTYYPNSDLPEDMDQSSPGTCQIEPGNNVVVTLANGEKAEGNVELISSQEIVLNRDERSLQPREYALDQVYSIKKINDGSSPATAIIGVTMGLVIVGGFIAYNELSDMQFGISGK